MKTLTALLTTATLLTTIGSANAWTDRAGRWHEGPGYVAPYSPASPLRYGYGAPAYGPPPVYYGAPVYTPPVPYYGERPTDTQIAIGVGLGILGAIIAGQR